MIGSNPSTIPAVFKPPIRPTGKVSLNDTTPFSPRSEGVVSTMRATSASHQLMSALPHLNVPDQPVEDSILAPSKTTSSVEEMQRSLSSNDSDSSETVKNNPESSVLDKSVSFHPRTEICQFLATPQVKEAGARYRVEEGHTKNMDGVSGLHKMLLAGHTGEQGENAEDEHEDDDQDPQ